MLTLVGVQHGVLGESRSGFSPSLNRNEHSVFSQILAYKDDFKSERADRERAHSRIQELEEKVMSLMSQASQRQVRAQETLSIRISNFEPLCLQICSS